MDNETLQPDPESGEHSPTPEAAPPLDGRTVSALVDDDRNILTSVSIALQSEGYATRVYSDGEAALKALLDNPPHLAVFDIKMPKMDGMELLRRLREHSARPVIFLTSKDHEQDEEAGLELGAGAEAGAGENLFGALDLGHLGEEAGAEVDLEVDLRGRRALGLFDVRGSEPGPEGRVGDALHADGAVEEGQPT